MGPASNGPRPSEAPGNPLPSEVPGESDLLKPQKVGRHGPGCECEPGSCEPDGKRKKRLQEVQGYCEEYVTELEEAHRKEVKALQDRIDDLQKSHGREMKAQAQDYERQIRMMRYAFEGTNGT